MKEIDFTTVPVSFRLCFNSQCPMSDRCLHYQTGLQLPPARTAGEAVYPNALSDGQCHYFREAAEQQMAWGFSMLYEPLKRYFRGEARESVKQYLGSNGTYYRYHHGERRLTTAQQEQILRILQQYGHPGPLVFDHHEPGYDFGVGPASE